ncbi:MAG TPA: NDP-sugar synthase [Actinomycetota bacterium]
MKALILAGGLGTRLLPVTEHVPKSLLPICNVPFLEHQVRLLARHGVDEAVLLTGYRARDFESFATSAARHGVRLVVSTEDEPLGTAGAVRLALDPGEDTALVFNGDVLTDIDVSALLALHRARNAAVTIALSWVQDADGLGVVPMDDDGRVTAFIQNVKGTPMPGDWINAGIYALEPRVLAGVSPGERRDFEHPPDPLFPALLAAGERFAGYRSEAYWLDIGTRERYLRAHRDVLDGVAGAAAVNGTVVREDRTLDDGTRIAGPVLLSHAAVGPGATLGPHTSLGQGCSIGAGAVVERSVVLAGAHVGERAVVRDSIVGGTATVEDGATLDAAIVA